MSLSLSFFHPTFAAFDSTRNGAAGLLPPQTGGLLVDYYEAFLRDKDIDAFRRNVSARYNEATLARLLQSGEPQARRASVLALGLFGGFSSNAAVARGLRDPDPTVRALADNALWSIWFRADTPENNEALEQIRDLIGRRRLDLAIDQANQLIARSPNFAEAYNQRAIAHFFQGRFAESVADCRKVLIQNPYHTGALSGMGQCQLRLGHREEAIETFRRALKIQPYNEGLREMIAELEAEGR
jgi:tetratricopeptide (TPR) repeat protein